MAKVIFNFNWNELTIQCNIQEKMKEICQRFISKYELDINRIYFLYNGNRIDENLTFEQIATEENKAENIVKILVDEVDITPIDKYIKSNEVICPKCGEDILISIKDYKINLYNCKNQHSINDILFNEFENIQKIDLSKIICNNCWVKNKGNSYNNEFFICLSCMKNICPLCKLKHDKSHQIINYEQRKFICDKHDDIYIKFCQECLKNLCMQCENEHTNHNITYLGDMIHNKSKIINEMKE